MLAVVGLMAGMYILTRMVEIIDRRSDQPKIGFLGFMAVMTILATFLAMIYFIFGPSAFSDIINPK